MKQMYVLCPAKKWKLAKNPGKKLKNRFKDGKKIFEKTKW